MARKLRGYRQEERAGQEVRLHRRRQWGVRLLLPDRQNEGARPKPACGSFRQYVEFGDFHAEHLQGAR